MIVTILATSAIATGALAADKFDRTVLPVPEPKLPSITTFDARNVEVARPESTGRTEASFNTTGEPL